MEVGIVAVMMKSQLKLYAMSRRINEVLYSRFDQRHPFSTAIPME